VTKKVCLLTILLLVALAAGCSRNHADQTSATATASPTTTQAPDNSEITTAVDASGTKTETRTFRDNPRISRVVVTTRDGRRTVKAYSPRGEEREVTTVENVMEATGERVAAAAGFVADKAEDVPGEAKKVGAEAADKAEDAGDKAKSVGAEVADKAEDVGGKAKQVGEKTVDVSKKAGEKTVEGAKKVGETTKKAVKKVIP
jgi:hypothetical protein